jgi:hypothetical protein
MLPLIDT